MKLEKFHPELLPEYSNDGGMESERTFVKQIVQKYIDDGSSDELFNESTIDEVSGDSTSL